MWLIFDAAGEDYFFELTGSETVQQILDVFKTDYDMGGNLVMAVGSFALTQPNSRICDVPGLHEMARVTVQDANSRVPPSNTAFSGKRIAQRIKLSPAISANIAPDHLPAQSLAMPPLTRQTVRPPTVNAVRPLAWRPHIVRPITEAVAGPRR
jgi:hypothetical protein